MLNMMPISTTQKFKLSYSNPNKSMRIQGFGNGSVIPIGVLSVNLKVDQAVANVEVFVVRDEELSILLLVGQPFTEKEHITMVRRGKTLRFFEEHISEDPDDCLQNMEVPILPRADVKLWAKEATVIPSNYVGFISAYCNFSEASTLYVENRQNKFGAIIPNCIINNYTGEFPIPVMDITKQDIKFEQDEKITSGKICVEQKNSNSELSDNKISKNECVSVYIIGTNPNISKFDFH